METESSWATAVISVTGTTDAASALANKDEPAGKSKKAKANMKTGRNRLTLQLL
jgi:hypothetical protein